MRTHTNTHAPGAPPGATRDPGADATALPGLGLPCPVPPHGQGPNAPSAEVAATPRRHACAVRCPAAPTPTCGAAVPPGTGRPGEKLKNQNGQENDPITMDLGETKWDRIPPMSSFFEGVRG